MEQAKRIPYGVSNFVDIVERNQYYVDKTMYLPMLENEADSLFFIRPRRFGKSLFISMMQAYYDIDQKDRFQELFGTFNQMLGFSTEDVYDMIAYYQRIGKISPDADVDAIVADMKPWYDNYCLSVKALSSIKLSCSSMAISW